MPTLHIHLLGDFRLSRDEAPIRTLNAPRLHALLAYLLLHRDAPQPRHHLAFVLWPDTTEAQARTNLRHLVYGLKQTLPEADRFIHADAQTVQWHPEAPYRLDVADFEQACARAEAATQQGDLIALRVALEQASALYQGDLLPSCYDDWILPARERLRQAFTGALQGVLRLLERAGQPREALPYAERLVCHDPLREETYRILMRLHAQCGDRAGVLRVYHTCTSVLERELGVEPSAATRDAYAYLLKVDIQARPVLSPMPSTTNLPVPLTSFVGRTRELAELTRLFSSTRLLTLTGSGGTGKTRLALEMAMHLLGEYPHGIWLVDLAPLADPTLVAQTVASTLGVREQPQRSIVDALLDYVHAKTLLLILDNCEHLIEPCANLAETLLGAAPNVRILASSREAFGIAGETAYRVPPLTLPDPPDPRQPHNLNALAQLAQNDCVRLFVERATAAYPPFRLTAQNAPAIAQIGRRLDGIPLAIELAAARARVFAPDQIAARLDDRFRLLMGGSRTALPRHQTLLALIEWSHNLLTVTERMLLRRLSVFAGGWSLEAAQTVCSEGLGEAGQGEEEVLDTLAHLAEKSLVEVDASLNAAEWRYHLLETIRQYAREKLLASGEADAVRERHLDFFLRFAEAAEARLRSAEQLAWLDRLERDHDNLRTALAWALERGMGDRALQLGGALAYLWELRGYWSEGHKWLDDALALAERAPAERGAAGEPSTPPAADMAWRAKALYGAARVRFATHFEPAASRTIVEESLRLWRELEDTWWMAVALEHLGFMLSVEGDVQTARARLEQGVSLARQVEDRWPLAVCLVRLGSFLPLMERAAARSIREEAVAVARSVGDKSVLSQGVFGLATDHLLERNLAAAAPAAEEALAQARAIGSAQHVFLSSIVLVTIACLQGDPAKANGYCLQALAFAREMGSPRGLLLVLFAFGVAACFGGEPLRGVRLLAATETLLRQSGINIRAEGMRDLMMLKQALDASLETAHAHLDPLAFEVAWAEGQQMTLEQALALATENASQDAPLLGSGLGPSSQ